MHWVTTERREGELLFIIVSVSLVPPQSSPRAASHLRTRDRLRRVALSAEPDSLMLTCKFFSNTTSTIMLPRQNQAWAAHEPQPEVTELGNGGDVSGCENRNHMLA